MSSNSVTGMKKYTLNELLAVISYTSYSSSGEVEFWKYDPIEEGGPGSLCFYQGSDPIEIEATIVLKKDNGVQIGVVMDHPWAVVLCEDPKASYVEWLQWQFPQEGGKDPTAIVYDEYVERNHTVYIGPLSVIGGTGYGYVQTELGWQRFPHIGKVEIGPYVDIGSHVVIDRATLGVTRIGRGTKINHHVMIGHNVQIGEDCMIGAHSSIHGSAKIGNNVRIAPGVRIRDWVTIGDNTLIGMGAIVTKDIPEGVVAYGNPAEVVRKND